MTKIVSLREAKAGGLTTYFTGVLCLRGHIAPRYTSSRACSKCNSEKIKNEWSERRKANLAANLARNNEHKRRYARANPDKVKETKQRSRTRHAETNRAYKAKYTEKNRKRIRAVDAKYRATNPEKVKAARRAWIKANRGKVNALARKRNDRHRDAIKLSNRRRYYSDVEVSRAKGRAQVARRRARKRGSAGHYSPKDIKRILEAQRHRCGVCGKELGVYHVDHIVPLARGGSNAARNIQILCPPCNQKKLARDPIEFMQSMGRLL